MSDATNIAVVTRLDHVESKVDSVEERIASLDNKVEETRCGVSDIRSRLFGDEDVEPEKSLLWRVNELEREQNDRNRIRNWVMAGAFTAIGGLLVTLAMNATTSSAKDRQHSAP